GAAVAFAADGEVIERKGKWESGSGSTWYNVVGRLKNTSSHALKWVKLRIDAVDDKGKVVASTDTYNETAEVLTVPEANPQDLLAKGKVPPIPAGGEQRFRGSFLKDETPPFTSYRVTIVETPRAEADAKAKARSRASGGARGRGGGGGRAAQGPRASPPPAPSPHPHPPLPRPPRCGFAACPPPRPVPRTQRPTPLARFARFARQKT